MFTRENRSACRSRRNRRSTRTTAGMGSSRLTVLMVRSRLCSITSTLPRKRSVIARVQGSTLNGCQSWSRNRTIVMAHLLLCFFVSSHPRDSNSASPAYRAGAAPSLLGWPGALGPIRTDTVLGLSQVPLPLGHERDRYRRRDSNPHCLHSECSVSFRWTTPASVATGGFEPPLDTFS